MAFFHRRFHVNDLEEGENDGCYAIDPVYKCKSVNRDAMVWTGDQGLVIGGMVDLMDMEGVTDPP